MAFESAVTSQGVQGNKKITKGTYTNASGDSGGDVDTALIMCESLVLQPNDTAVIANAAVVNETLPVSGAAVTIVTTASEDGVWIAEGY